MTVLRLLSATAAIAIGITGIAVPTGFAQVTTKPRTPFVSGLNGPRGLAFGPDGSLYIAEAGTGGTISTASVCPADQVPVPTGPYLGGATATIKKVDVNGKVTVLAKGLPSSQNAIGDTFGIADLAFLNGNLYAVVASGGCSHGNPVYPNGIVKVNLKNGSWDYITDLGIFYREHPAANTDADDFEADGVPYALLPYKGDLLTVEANHGQITRTTPDGKTTLLADLSASQGHIIPTSIATDNDNLYVGNLGPFPVFTGRERVITLSKNLVFFDTTPGLETKAKDVDTFRVASSLAGLTTVVSVKFGPDGLLYALEITPVEGYPTGMPTGMVVRLNRNGTIVPVISGLTLPTGMAFGPDNALYVSNNGDGPAGAGEIMRYALSY